MLFYRYVPHRKVAAFLRAGWLLADTFDGTHHGRHAVLMRACACFREAGDARTEIGL